MPFSWHVLSGVWAASAANSLRCSVMMGMRLHNAGVHSRGVSGERAEEGGRGAEAPVMRQGQLCDALPAVHVQGVEVYSSMEGHCMRIRLQGLLIDWWAQACFCVVYRADVCTPLKLYCRAEESVSSSTLAKKTEEAKHGAQHGVHVTAQG